MKNKKDTAQKLTPKQAAIVAGNLMKGLDNSIKEAERSVQKLSSFRDRVGSLTAGLSNLASAASAKPPAAKPVKAMAAPKAAKPAPKAAKPTAKPAKALTAPKSAKPAKAAPAPKTAKPAKAGAAVKAAKPAKSDKAAKAAPKATETEKTYGAPVPGRPSLREAVKESIRADGQGSPIVVYDRVCTKYGYWSKQSYYVLLKNDAEIKVEKSEASKDSTVSLVAAGSKPAAKKAEPKTDKVEALVRQVEADRATSAVV